MTGGWNLGSGPRENRAHEIWVTMPQCVCHRKQWTQLPTSTELLPTFTKNTLKIHRIMNGLKECSWKQREPNTHLPATECLDHTQNKLKLFTMFPIFFYFFPLHLTIKKVFINKWAPLWFIYNHKWTLNSILYKHLKKYWEWSMVGNIAHIAN